MRHLTHPSKQEVGTHPWNYHCAIHALDAQTKLYHIGGSLPGVDAVIPTLCYVDAAKEQASGGVRQGSEIGSCTLERSETKQK